MKTTTHTDVLRSFEYTGVTLGAGPFKRQFTETLEYYLAIPNDSLLYPFRKRSGLPTPGQSLDGWYGTGTSTFGQKLGALAKAYRVTGEARAREKALYLAEEWGRCVDREPALLKNGTYVYEKLLGGYLDMYEYLGYERGLVYASRLTDNAIADFKRDIKRDGLQDAGLTTTDMIEWYTLPENLYRAFQITGDRKYRAFAEEWEYDYYWDKLRSGDTEIGPRHAYSHVNTLSSAARAYEVKHDRKYLETITGGYDLIASRHVFATGGYGPAECLFVEHEGYLGDSLKSTWDPGLGSLTYRNFGGGIVSRDDTWGSCEVPCCAWAVFKLCNYLLRFTGDPRYGDWVERLLYNGTGAQLALAPGGKIMYYASYFQNGAVKSVEDRRLFRTGESFHWQCCTGTFPQDVVEYHNLIYYHDDGAIHVSQYLPSTVRWSKDGAAIGLTNFSRYPEEDSPRFLLETDREVHFALKLRVPSWVEGPVTAKVNGADVPIEAAPNTWATLSRTWTNGDVVSLHLPFSLRFVPVDAKNPEIAALCYGPIVLVAEEMADLVGDIRRPDDWIRPVEGATMTFRTEAGHVAPYDFVRRTFVPFHRVGAMRWYFMYNRVRPA
jgi:hypothetical protein